MLTSIRNSRFHSATDWEELSALCLPAGLLAFWNIVLVALVCWYQPLRPWLPWLAGISILAIGAILWQFTPRARQVLLLTLVFGLPTAWVVLAERTGEIWPVPVASAHMDSWTYAAMAEHLRDYRQDAVVGLAMTDQWASRQQHTRFSAPCLLALARLVGDPLDAQTCLLWFCLVANFGALAAFARVTGLGLLAALVTASFGVITGWHGTAAITVGNYDNLTFVAIACAAMAILLAWWHDMITTTFFWIAFALLVAGLMLTYPEGTVLLGLLVLPWALYLVAKARAQRRRALVFLGTVATAIFLSLPYLPTAVKQLTEQNTFSNREIGHRPGDHNFDGLLTERATGAFFATGQEYPNAPFSWPATIFGLIMTGLAVDGLRRLRHTIPWYPWVGLSFGGLLFWQGGLRHYEYGVYKVIFCASWWIYPAIASSVKGLLVWRARLWFFTAVGGLMVASVALQHSARAFRVWPQSGRVIWLKELGQLRPWLMGKSVVIVLENDFAHIWSTLMLRGVPLALGPPRTSFEMPHVRELIANAPPLPAGQPNIQIGVPGLPGEILHTEHFALYPGTRPLIEHIENPNGVERVEGRQFLWIGHEQETTIHLSAVLAGTYILTAPVVTFGPSAPSSSVRNLEITDALGTRIETLTHEKMSVRIKLTAGHNTLLLRCTDVATVHIQPNGDNRELLLGVTNLRIDEVAPSPGRTP